MPWPKLRRRHWNGRADGEAQCGRDFMATGEVKKAKVYDGPGLLRFGAGDEDEEEKEEEEERRGWRFARR